MTPDPQTLRPATEWRTLRPGHADWQAISAFTQNDDKLGTAQGCLSDPDSSGRDELRETVRIALERTRLGRPTKSILMVGLRGVGKTVWLDRMRLEHDLQALLEVAGAAAQKADTALAMFVDELKYVEEDELAALITALHRTAKRRLPVVLVGAGLPQLRGRMGRAKSYAERLCDFREIGPLLPPAARNQA